MGRRLLLTEGTLRRVLLESIKQEFQDMLVTVYDPVEAKRIVDRLLKAGGVDFGQLKKRMRAAEASGFMEEFKAEIGGMVAPTAREVREMVDQHANANTIRKDLTTPSGERYAILFKMSHSAAVKASRMAGGSKLCTASDKTCQHFNERSGPGAESVLVTLLPLSPGLVADSLREKRALNRRSIGTRDPDFDRAVAVQLMLHLPDWRGPSFGDEAAWYDDVMIEDDLPEVLRKLYGIGSAAEMLALLEPAERERVVGFAQGAPRAEGNVRLMEQWIRKFPGRMVTKLPPEGSGINLDDISSEAEPWGMRGLTVPIGRMQFSNATFERCEMVSDGQSGSSLTLDACKLKGTTVRDVSSVYLLGSEATDCEFRKIGVGSWGTLKLTDSTVRDCRIAGCELDSMGASKSEVTNSRFENCQMEEADFQICNLIEIEWRGCDLSEALFRGIKGRLRFLDCNVFNVSIESSEGIVAMDGCKNVRTVRSNVPVTVDGKRMA
jgi:uncharacterized protein YjbI with pentapeptide repeats